MANPPSMPSAPPPWPTAQAPRRRWPTLVWTFAIAVLSVVAIVGWLRPLREQSSPSAPPTPSYTDQQVADAKATVCAAFAKVDHALDISGARGNGSDPAMQLAIATSGRQVLDAGSRYLLTKLAEEPATSPDLAKAIRQQADSFQELMIGYLDELSNSDPQQQPALKASDEATATLRRLCK